MESFDLQRTKEYLKRAYSKLEASPSAKWLLISSAVFSSYLLYRRVQQRRQIRDVESTDGALVRLELPPSVSGSRNLPVFGSFFSMVYNGDDFPLKILPTLGPIGSYWLGKQLALIINDAKLVDTMFRHKLCINRPQIFSMPLSEDHTPFFAFVNNDKHWWQRRKMILNAVSALSARDCMDAQTKHLFNKFVHDQMRVYCVEKCAWFPREDLRNASFNLVWGSFFGPDKQLSRNNEDFRDYNHGMEVSVNTTNLQMMGHCLPGATGALLIARNLHRKGVNASSRVMNKYVGMAVEQFDEKFGKNTEKIGARECTESTDSTLFEELYKQILDDAKEWKESREQRLEFLKVDIVAMVAGAIDTTAHTLETAILYLGKFEKLQQEIYEEIERFRTRDEENKYWRVLLKYVNKCVKFRAFVHEMIRIASGLPLGVPRAVIRDCKLSFNVSASGECVDIDFGEVKADENDDTKRKDFTYLVPKDALIQANLNYMNNHGRPFDINLWIGQNEQGEMVFRSNADIISFSVGIRDCPGYSLAKRELYSFLANLMVNYKFAPSDPKADIRFKQDFVKKVDPELAIIMTKRE